MKKKCEKKIKLTDDDVLKRYHDPQNPGSYGGVTRFAKAVTPKRRLRTADRADHAD